MLSEPDHDQSYWDLTCIIGSADVAFLLKDKLSVSRTLKSSTTSGSKRSSAGYDFDGVVRVDCGEEVTALEYPTTSLPCHHNTVLPNPTITVQDLELFERGKKRRLVRGRGENKLKITKIANHDVEGKDEAINITKRITPSKDVDVGLPAD